MMNQPETDETDPNEREEIHVMLDAAQLAAVRDFLHGILTKRLDGLSAEEQGHLYGAVRIFLPLLTDLAKAPDDALVLTLRSAPSEMGIEGTEAQVDLARMYMCSTRIH